MVSIVHPLKLVLQAVLAAVVARAAQAVLVAPSAPPQDTGDVGAGAPPARIVVLQACGRTSTVA